MPQVRPVEVTFPVGGLVRNTAFQRQAPYTTNDCSNVRPRDVANDRGRGGSRPGTGKAYTTQLGSGAAVRMLQQVTVAESGTAKQVSIVDDFNLSALGSDWSTASWVGSAPSIASGAATASGGGTAAGSIHATVSDLTTASPYTVAIFIRPYLGNHHGTYYLYARLNDSTPLVTTDGIQLALTMQGDDGSFSGTLKAYDATSETSWNLTSGSETNVEGGWLVLEVDGSTVTATWRDNTLISQNVSAGLGAGAGTRVGFGMSCTGPGDTTVEGRCIIEVFDHTYISSATQNQYRAYLMAVAGGKLYKSATFREMVQETSGASNFTTNRQFTAAEWNQKLYIADPGKGLFYYDPVADTLTDWAAAVTGGTAPSNCHIIARYRDALVLAGDPSNPQVWYKTRNGNPLDFDYSASAGDATRPVAGNNSEAGQIGEPITALAAYSDDFLIMGATGSIYVMRGDPASSGIIDVVSNTIGILGPYAWDYGPEGQLIFLSSNGFYMLPPGAGGPPVALSEQPLPDELRDLPVNNIDASVAFDPVARGVHIFVSEAGKAEPTNFWFDWPTKTFWPQKLGQRPTVAKRYKAPRSGQTTVILGGEDGYLREFDRGYTTDDDTAFTASVKIGPLSLGVGQNWEGLITEMAGTMGRESGSVSVKVRVGESAEEALTTTTDFYTATWGEGLSYSDRPRARGQAACLVIEGTVPWMFERAHVTIKSAGKQRRL